MAKDTTLIVFFKLGWETVESSMYIVEQELDFLMTRSSPFERELANCIWLRLRTRPSEMKLIINLTVSNTEAHFNSYSEWISWFFPWKAFLWWDARTGPLPNRLALFRKCAGGCHSFLHCGSDPFYPQKLGQTRRDPVKRHHSHFVTAGVRNVRLRENLSLCKLHQVSILAFDPELLVRPHKHNRTRHFPWLLLS